MTSTESILVSETSTEQTPLNSEAITKLIDIRSEISPEVDCKQLDAFLESEWIKSFPDLAIDVYTNMIEVGLKNNNLSKVLYKMFNAPTPSDRRLEIYTLNHLFEYNHLGEEYAKWLINNPGKGLLFEACMDAGKSTFAEIVLRIMEEEGYEVDILIAAIGDDLTSARCFGEQGKRQAIQVNDDNIEVVLANIKAKISTNPKRVVYFDEATFVSQLVIDRVVEFCEENNLNYILAGLNRDSLGRYLEIMSHIYSKIVNLEKVKTYKCRAYTMSQTDAEVGMPELDEEGNFIISPEKNRTKYKGNGTYTYRYVVFPDGSKIVDPGALPQIESKTEPFVEYGPEVEDEHFINMIDSEILRKRIFEIVPAHIVYKLFQENPDIENDENFKNIIKTVKQQLYFEQGLKLAFQQAA